MTLSVAALVGLAAPVLATSTSLPTVQASTYSTSEMRSYVRNVLAQNHMRGSVVVIKDGQPQQISYGWAWYGRRYGNGNARVVYPTGSLQKVITAAIVIQLMNERNHTDQEFSQDTKISRWYPNLKNADNITLGELMTHTSGITATGTEINRGIDYYEDDAINWVVNKVNSMPEGQPGNYFYNNTNYMLLAGIIKKVSGQSYEANFASRIVNKLGLTNTYLYRDIPDGKTDAISYLWNGRNNYKSPAYVKRSLASQLPGAGNLFTTPMDYYKMQVGLTNGSILSKADFHYLTHLNSRVNNYSGGVYLANNDTLKSAYGNLAGTHFGNWFQMTTDNQNGMVMFLNQTHGTENTQKDVGYQILNHVKPGTFLSR